MQEFEQIVKSGYYITITILSLILISRYIFYYKTKKQRILINQERLPFKFFRFFTIILLPIFLMGLIDFIFVLQKGNIFAPNGLKIALLFLMILIWISESYYNSHILPRRPARILNIIISVIFLIVGIYLNLLFISANKYPPVDQSVIVDLPFEGTWIATGAGASILTNHHDMIPSQKYAIDISRVGKNGKLFNGAEESNTYGAEILSPVDGKVVYIIDTLPDHPVRERDKLAGNHIVIQFHDTLYAALAHLQPYSIPLKVGDNVQSGALIGKAGMSGNTDICHLHIHIQDGPVYNIETSKTYPIRFKKFQRKRFLFWHNQEDQYLLSNDWVKYPVDQ